MKDFKTASLTIKQKKLITAVMLFVVIVFVTFISFTVGKPLIKFVSEPEKFRNWVNSYGLLSRIGFISMVTFQVVFALLPGEPFEIGAGYAFGFFEGTLLTLIGTVVGSVIIFFLVRTVGIKVIEVFFSLDKIRSLKFLQNTRRLNFITFIILFIPGTPKDLISYFLGITEINFWYYLFCVTFARIPSIITSVMGGSALGEKQYKSAIIVFILTAIISAAGVIVYKIICKRHEKQ